MDKKNFSRPKKVAAIAAAALLASASIPLFANPEAVLAADETRTYAWSNGQGQPSIPQTITGADGREYHLTSQSAPVQASGSQNVTQFFTQNVNSQIWPDQLSNIANIVPRTFHVDSDGFNGDIPRTGINYTPIYRSENNVVTTTHTEYAATQEQARAALPATVEYLGRTLSLTDNVQFEPARVESSGTITLWKAVGTYSANVPRQVLDHYDVVAHYAGNLSKTMNNGDWSIRATYSNNDPVGEEGENNAPEEPQENEGERTEGEETSENPEPSDEIIEMDPEQMDENGNRIPFDYEKYMGTNANADNSYDAEENDTLSLIPILAAGAVVLGGVAIAGIMIVRKKKAAQSNQQSPAKEDMQTYSDSIPASSSPMFASMPPVSPVAATIAAMEMMPEEPFCQLIEVVSTPEEDVQTPKANLEIMPSISQDVPTIIYFPALVDGNGDKVEFVATPGAEYWIAIDEDTVEAVVSKEIVVVTDDEKEIFRAVLIDGDGTLTSQVILPEYHMIDILNAADGEADEYDISAELEEYDELSAAAEQLALEEKDGRIRGVAGDADTSLYSDMSFENERDEFGDNSIEEVNVYDFEADDFDNDDIIEEDEFDEFHDVEEIDDLSELDQMFGERQDSKLNINMDNGDNLLEEEFDFDSDFDIDEKTSSDFDEVDELDEFSEFDDIDIYDEFEGLGDFDNFDENDEFDEVDELDEDFDDSEELEEEPSYASLIFGEEETADNEPVEEEPSYDSDFEKEMDDYNPYEGIQDPDEDGLDFSDEDLAELDGMIDEIDELDGDLSMIGEQGDIDVFGETNYNFMGEEEIEVADYEDFDADNEYERFKAMLADK